jgi:hypothetical protein
VKACRRPPPYPLFFLSIYFILHVYNVGSGNAALTTSLTTAERLR